LILATQKCENYSEAFGAGDKFDCWPIVARLSGWDPVVDALGEFSFLAG
jgi:hypothetical protein